MRNHLQLVRLLLLQQKSPAEAGRASGESGLLAGAELEVIDVRAPDEVAAGVKVFSGEPQGAVVNRIYAETGVIAPTGVTAL